MVPGQLPSEENCPPVMVRVGLGLVLGLGAIFLGGNCPKALSDTSKGSMKAFKAFKKSFEVPLSSVKIRI